MRNPFARPKLRHHTAPGFYHYHLGMEYHADAMEMVFNSNFSNPAQTFIGAGTRAGALRVTQPAQVIFQRRTMRTGIPTQAGTFVLQPLVSKDGQ